MKGKYMDKLQFLGFEPTPGEKHLGIATVRVNGDFVFVLRFKIVSKKDGSGHFPTVASYKMSRGAGDEYEPSFMLDSRSDNEMINKFVMSNVHKSMNVGRNAVAQPQEQLVPNYMQQAQQSTPFVQRPEYQNSPNSMPDMPPFNNDDLPF